MNKHVLLIAFLLSLSLVINAQDKKQIQNAQNDADFIEQGTNLKGLPLEPILDINARNVFLSGYIRGYSSIGGALKINSGNGYIDIGPRNTSWAHIYTDRPKFIFNKDIYSYNGVFSSYNTANLYLRTNGTTRMTILKSNGNVGIGTTNPQANLHVYKSFRPTFILENSFNKFYIAIANNGSDFSPYSKPGDVVFRTINGGKNDHHGMIFNMPDDDKDGNSYIKFTDNTDLIMGIFNDSKVRIDGQLITKALEVKTNVWSDFVFEKDYSLMSLQDLEKYINKHKHLPGVPSEKEVIKNGINVAEMNVILMQKIEELTLYMIEQDKRVKELENKIKELTR